MSTAEHNKNIAKKAVVMWSTGNVKDIEQIYAPNCINHQRHHPSGVHTLKGPDAWRRFIHEFRHSFPDYQDTVEDQIAEGNKVVTRLTCHGTHKGSFMGFDPTNKKIQWSGILIDKIENGKIVETWADWDLLGMLEQIGAVNLKTHQ
jgi:steroid delta-isomerase-like uncharacterized protein